MPVAMHHPKGDRSAGQDPRLPMGGSRGEMIATIAVFMILALLVLGFLWQAAK